MKESIASIIISYGVPKALICLGRGDLVKAYMMTSNIKKQAIKEEGIIPFKKRSQKWKRRLNSANALDSEIWWDILWKNREKIVEIR